MALPATRSQTNHTPAACALRASFTEGRRGMASSLLETKGFFTALFDFGFTSFITLKFLRVIYTFLVCLILLVGLLFLVIGLAQGGGTAVVVIFLAPLATLLYLIFVRIYMELIAMFFRIGENTSIMAAKLTGQAPPPAAPGYGYDPGAATGPPTPSI
jgi:hypothetical protein